MLRRDAVRPRPGRSTSGEPGERAGWQYSRLRARLATRRLHCRHRWLTRAPGRTPKSPGAWVPQPGRHTRTFARRRTSPSPFWSSAGAWSSSPAATTASGSPSIWCGSWSPGSAGEANRGSSQAPCWPGTAGLAVEDEGRLRNRRIREHFLDEVVCAGAPAGDRRRRAHARSRAVSGRVHPGPGGVRSLPGGVGERSGFGEGAEGVVLRGGHLTSSRSRKTRPRSR